MLRDLLPLFGAQRLTSSGAESRVEPGGRDLSGESESNENPTRRFSDAIGRGAVK
jgi:hypothetical protein